VPEVRGLRFDVEGLSAEVRGLKTEVGGSAPMLHLTLTTA